MYLGTLHKKRTEAAVGFSSNIPALPASSPTLQKTPLLVEEYTHLKNLQQLGSNSGKSIGILQDEYKMLKRNMFFTLFNEVCAFISVFQKT